MSPGNAAIYTNVLSLCGSWIQKNAMKICSEIKLELNYSVYYLLYNYEILLEWFHLSF